uniref:Retrotransposon protein, putative, Ty1-copia subclass n=1 Tax=Oryza sativa subsp. japonica TaxID=39947 RepID=Q10JW5_ORYSJ|nr:retrotransposon protein, putative, Ty1-copia subclass [Oryza sativa Japonica Group]
MGTQITIEDALLYHDSTRTLLSYKDICQNGFHIETHMDNREEFLLLTKQNGYGKRICEKIPSLTSGLNYTYIKPIAHVAYKVIFQNVDAFHTWHDRLGHPGIGMMRKIIDNSIGHHLITDKFPKSSDFVCTACATGKLILRPSYLKIRAEPLKFLERIQGDICCLIVPRSGPFRKVGIYVGFKSPSIIKYLEPLTGDLFTARFADSIFDEEHFPALGRDFKYQKECQEIDWDVQGIPASDPRTTETELQVQKIIHLQRLANNLPDAFTNYKGVTKSFIPAKNAPERVELMDVVTAYLYGSLDYDIYMKVPDGIDIPNQKKSLYGLKQSGRMWYNRLNVEKDPFRPKEDGEDVLGPDFPYLSAIGALMYFANSTRPDIAFSVKLLARYSAAPTKRHWTGVKNVFRYLNGTRDLGLFFKKNQDSTLIGYTDAGYLSDPHNTRSQTGFVFLQGGTAISWKSSKQTLVATSTNHSEIIALYKASRECVWLRSMVNHILTSCSIGSLESPTIIYEDNGACVV